jgi:hypothetical protein
MINENNYRGLSKKDLNSIKSFEIKNIDKKVSYSDSCYIYEINSVNIRNCAMISKFLWIHLWRPYCKTDYCQNISYFSSIADQYRINGLNFLLISESYDLKEIKGLLEKNNFDRPVYVLQDSYFGHGLKSAKKKFLEINNHLIQNPNFIYNDDFIFKDTLLIFACSVINKKLFDSVMSVNMK